MTSRVNGEFKERLLVTTLKDSVGKCPACGADEVDGCSDPKQCIDMLNHSIQEMTGHIVELATHDPNDRPFRLLMASFDVFDLISIGVAVTNSSGHLLIANRTAEQIFASRDGVELNARREVRFSKSDGPSLLQLLRQIHADPSTETNAVIVAVERPSGKRPVTVLLRPATAIPDRRKPVAPSALMLLSDPELSAQSAEEELRELYGFTATEARVANLLMDGKNLDGCCRELDIRSTTMRMHMRNMFQKTGVHKQSQLVSLLMKSVGLVKTGRKMPRTRPQNRSRASLSGGKLSASAARMLKHMSHNRDSNWLNLLSLNLDI